MGLVAFTLRKRNVQMYRVAKTKSVDKSVLSKSLHLRTTSINFGVWYGITSSISERVAQEFFAMSFSKFKSLVYSRFFLRCMVLLHFRKYTSVTVKVLNTESLQPLDFLKSHKSVIDCKYARTAAAFSCHSSMISFRKCINRFGEPMTQSIYSSVAMESFSYSPRVELRYFIERRATILLCLNDLPPPHTDLYHSANWYPTPLVMEKDGCVCVDALCFTFSCITASFLSYDGSSAKWYIHPW